LTEYGERFKVILNDQERILGAVPSENYLKVLEQFGVT
jgi:hypothetical protein